jgi:hypothetical protein
MKRLLGGRKNRFQEISQSYNGAEDPVVIVLTLTHGLVIKKYKTHRA